MSVLIETSKGDIVVDLYYEKCPKACQNFISLCQIKYYNNCLFFNIQKNFIAQTGDPTNTGQGGHSIYHLLNQIETNSTSKGPPIYFNDEIHLDLRHDKKGLICMANKEDKPNTNASQFYFTTTDRHLDYLDDSHTIFGEVAEGLDVLEKINNVFTNEEGKPYQVIRIRHTYVLYDPWTEKRMDHDQHLNLQPLPNLRRLIPRTSPDTTSYSTYEQLGFIIPEDDEQDMTDNGNIVSNPKSQEEIEEEIRVREGKSRALVLEMIGDLPSADMRPPDNVLFVCKLNPSTTDDDLAIIFGRFGELISCEIIRDHKTGESLCYGFVEFKSVEACEQAYLKMQNVVIDDRRIHVDFSQSVSKLWNRHYSAGHKRKPVQGTREYMTSNDRSRQNTGNYNNNRQQDAIPDRRPDKLQYKFERRRPDNRQYDFVFDEEDRRDRHSSSSASNHDRKRPLESEDSSQYRKRSRRDDSRDDGRYNDSRRSEQGRRRDYSPSSKNRDRHHHHRR